MDCLDPTLVALGTADLVLYTKILLLGGQQSLSFVLLYALVKAQILIVFSHLRSFLCNMGIGWPHSGIYVGFCPQLSWKFVSYMVHYFCPTYCVLL